MQKGGGGFSFDLKEESEEKLGLTERGREFQIKGPMYWKDPPHPYPRRALLPILGTRKIKIFQAETETDRETETELCLLVLCFPVVAFSLVKVSFNKVRLHLPSWVISMSYF